MTSSVDYSPKPIFSLADTGRETPPVGLIAPGRYVQGPRLLDHLDRFLALLPSARPAIFISDGGLRRHGEQLLDGLRDAQIEATVEIFQGECSLSEIDRAVASLQERQPRATAAGSRELPFDSLIAVGGGKCLDAGKCVAARLAVPVVICPTIASTDAPCSALSVIYSDEGIAQGGEFFPDSPALVLVDSQLIAAAPVRYLVAGMGDALATRYEARTCFRNPAGRSVLGGRPTITAQAIAELCAQTIFDDGIAAAETAYCGGETEGALERVIEANTLLSGLGFESGGVAAAHAVAMGLTQLPVVREQYLHGEMVAMGLLTHLALEQSMEECARVARFCAEIGLPTHLAQLSIDTAEDGPALQAAMASIADSPLMDNEPLAVTPENTWAALLQADEIGRAASAAVGDRAYRRLRGN